MNSSFSSAPMSCGTAALAHYSTPPHMRHSRLFTSVQHVRPCKLLGTRYSRMTKSQPTRMREVLPHKDRDETAIEKKLREKLEMAREKEQEKSNQKDVKAAEALLSKVEPKITELETIMSKSSVELVAGGIKNPVNDFLTKFTTYAGSARRVIKDGRARQPLPDLKDVMSEISQATKAKTLLQQMLAALAKAGH